MALQRGRTPPLIRTAAYPIRGDQSVPTRYLTLFVPRRQLNAMAVNPEDALARPIPASTEALRLLVDYLGRHYESTS